MCINFVISNTTHTSWTWRIVNEKGETIATSSQTFETRYYCIDDAEKFQQSIPDAGFYDFAGIPIDEMHLSNGRTHKGKKPIKIA
ncbi:hypothetical protein AB4K05_07070 [Kluyvera sp. STS39-E]|uniref:hypothetical protein n=1 Tax=Kluyvera sp. STS39-E TaxID=3234748 RepID=UPI002B160A84|nr:hypothetical protein [Kluyvera cryocrescens]